MDPYFLIVLNTSLGGVIGVHHQVWMTAVGLQHQPVRYVVGVDAPAAMAAGEHQGVVAAHLGGILVDGQLLASLHEPVVVQVELGPPGERGIGLVLVQMVAEGGHGLVGPYVRSVVEGVGHVAPLSEPHDASLAQRLYVSALGESSHDGSRILDPFDRHLVLVYQRAVGSEGLLQVVQPEGLAAAVLVLGDAPGLAPLRQLAAEQAEDLPLGLGLARRLDRFLGQGEEKSV